MNVEPFSLPLARPLGTADGTIDSREGALVHVEVDGTQGVGEATPLAGWTEPYEECLSALRGVEDPVAALESGALEATPAARHGLSLAVLDARARARGEPLYRHLGGEEPTDTVPVNATVGDGDPEATAAAAETAVDAGFPAVKLKVGSRPLAADLDRIEAVRRRCPDVTLRADANGAWDAPTAERALAALTDLDIAVLEQPLSAEDLSGHADLRGGPVDIALDESLLECGVDAALDAGAADVVVCKPMALGGVDTARELARRADSRGVAPIVTTTIDGAVARAGAVHLAASLPAPRACGLATGDRLASDLRADAAPVRDGCTIVPQGKGNIPPS